MKILAMMQVMKDGQLIQQSQNKNNQIARKINKEDERHQMKKMKKLLRRNEYQIIKIRKRRRIFVIQKLKMVITKKEEIQGQNQINTNLILFATQMELLQHNLTMMNLQMVVSSLKKMNIFPILMDLQKTVMMAGQQMKNKIMKPSLQP